MKKFMKGCAITAAVLCLLGLLLATAAGTARGSQAISEVVAKVTGGRVSVNLGDIKDWGIILRERVSEATTEVGDVIEQIEEVDAVEGTHVHYDIHDSSMFEHSYKIYKGDVDKYCPGTGIENLDIEVGGCILETEVSNDDNFYIEVEKAYKFQGYVKDQTLYIKASSGAKSWNKLGSTVVTLYVPEYFKFGTVDVEMGAGMLEFSDLRAGDLISLEVGAGQIAVDHIESNSLELEIGAGEIVLDDMEVWGELTAEIGMGNLEACGIVSADASIECSMGNVDLKLKDSEESYNYVLECAMGNIDIGNNSYSGLAKEKDINNRGAERTIKIECAMGNVTVSFKQ